MDEFFFEFQLTLPHIFYRKDLLLLCSENSRFQLYSFCLQQPSPLVATKHFLIQLTLSIMLKSSSQMELSKQNASKNGMTTKVNNFKSNLKTGQPMLSILVKPSCLSVLSKMGVSNMRHRTESNNMQRGTLMSFQEFSDGTLPEYFHNLWRKKFI